MMQQQSSEREQPLWHQTNTGWLVTDGRTHIHVENPVRVKP